MIRGENEEEDRGNLQRHRNEQGGDEHYEGGQQTYINFPLFFDGINV